MQYAFGAAPREAALFLFCGAIMALGGPITAYGAKLLVDAVLTSDLRAGLTAAALLAVWAGVSLMNTLYYLDFLFAVAEKSSGAVNRRLMALTAGVPGLAHHELPAYLKEMDLLREQRGALSGMCNATAGMVRVTVQLLATVVLFTRLHPALLLLPFFGFGSFWAGRKARDLQQAAYEATVEDDRRRRHLFTTATAADAAKELRVFGLQDELIARHHASAGRAMALRARADRQSAFLSGLGSLLFAFGYLGSIALVVLRAVDGRVTPGDVVLTVGLAAGMNGVVNVAVNYGTNYLRILRIAGHLLWLEDYVAGATRPPAAPAPVPGQLRTGIDLQDITFRYPTANGETPGKPILDGVTLHLPAGTVVALVGENGAGKTTLVKLLSRFYEPDSGHILVDGTDLRRLPIDQWRERLTAAFQDFSRFEFLARETVGVGYLPSIDETPAVEAALARAGGDDVPRILPRGLETQLGQQWPDGAELSGGQWQKLALGRSMMRPHPLLVIFDEPTSALDPQTEHALFERISDTARSGANAAGTVTLLISHRFSTVRMADHIVVLSDGRIVEQGSHTALMQRDGLYAELYRLQSRAYR